jgi:hypothetical protein
MWIVKGKGEKGCFMEEEQNGQSILFEKTSNVVKDSRAHSLE